MKSSRSKMQTALAQWHAPKAAEQIAENILSAIAQQQEKAAQAKAEEVRLRPRAWFGETRALKHDADR